MDESYVPVNHKWKNIRVIYEDEVLRKNTKKEQCMVIVIAHVITKYGPMIAPNFHNARGFFKREAGWFPESGT